MDFSTQPLYNGITSGVFCGTDKYLTLVKHFFDEPVYPVKEFDCYFLFVIKGSADFTINSVKFSVHPGSVCCIMSNHVLTIEKKGEESLELWSIVYDYQLFSYLMYRTSPPSLQTSAISNLPCIDFECPEGKRIFDLLNLFDEYNNNKSDVATMIKTGIVGQIYLLYYTRSKTYFSDNALKNLPLGYTASSYIAAHSYEEISLSDVAKALNTTPSILNRELRMATGMDYHQTLCNCRCVHASSYFLCENLSFANIATHVGFNSVVTFYRVFKNTTGMTPSEFRQAMMYTGSNPSRQYRGLIKDDRLYIIFDYLFDNKANQLNLNDLSKKIYISVPIIRRLLQENCHLEYKDILDFYNLTESTAMLSGTELSIKDVASSVGFKTAKTYSKKFAAKFGMTPAAYRKKCIDKRREYDEI